MKANKIVSSFYVIKINNNNPIYVGYTNRSLKTRLREHRESKGLPSSATIELIDTMAFDFTWNEQEILKNAEAVSIRENYLIHKFGTENSEYQKGLGDRLCGQTFASVIGFVRNNKDNPKYLGMSSEEVLEYLEKYRANSNYLSNFISSMNRPEATYLSNFIHHMNRPEHRHISDFINDMKRPEGRYIKDFINNMKSPEATHLSNFVSHMARPEATYLSNFVNHMTR